MTTEAQRRAQRRYDMKTRIERRYRGFYLKCHCENDADIIEALQNSGNINGYIKGLIRKDKAK